MADIDNTSLLIADIPGLIEGASEGKGLGDLFLRHVERTAVLLHLIDAYTDDIAKAYTTIRQELKNYSEGSIHAQKVVVLTKVEGLDDDIIAMQRAEIANVAPWSTKIMSMSSLAHTNLTEVLRELRREVDEVRSVESGDRR